ncbi:MAG: hypothetical protein WC612_06850 [Bdellovibrionales bacterium]|jgi:hypothetical protein
MFEEKKDTALSAKIVEAFKTFHEFAITSLIQDNKHLEISSVFLHHEIDGKITFYVKTPVKSFNAVSGIPPVLDLFSKTLKAYFPATESKLNSLLKGSGSRIAQEMVIPCASNNLSLIYMQEAYSAFRVKLACQAFEPFLDQVSKMAPSIREGMATLEKIEQSYPRPVRQRFRNMVKNTVTICTARGLDL